MTQQEQKKEYMHPARLWWKQLQPSKTDDNGYSRGDRAALAKLRRCSTWVEATAEPQTNVLFRMLGKQKEADLPRVAVLASVLAHVREDDKSRKVADGIGKRPGDDNTEAILSENRLRRLLTATGDDEILSAFRRLVAIMGRTANVADLADNILYWDHPETGDRTRVRFAFNYWKAGSAAPSPAQAPVTLAPENFTA
jgi:CRISPR system Cascade subunit CasB